MSLLACFKLHWFIDCSVLKLNPTMFFPLGFSDISCRIFLWTFSFISCGPRGGGRNRNARLAERSCLMSNQGWSKFLFWPRSVSKLNREMSFVVTSPVGLVSDEHLGSYQGRALKFRSQIGIPFIRSFFAVQVPSFRPLPFAREDWLNCGPDFVGLLGCSCM